MNIGRQAFGLFARCRQAVRPTLTSRCGLLKSDTSTERHQRKFSDQKNEENDNYPKLPVESPLAFANNVIQRGFKQVQWCIDELGMDRDDILNVNDAAEKILIFATECMAKEDFGTLEEKFSSEALEKAKSYVLLLPREERNQLIYEGTSTGFFASKYSFFFPWSYYAKDSHLVLSFVGFQFFTRSFRQTLWAITMAVPRDGTSVSEDWKVDKFYFETFVPPPEET